MKRAFWVKESKNSQAELDYLYNSRQYGLIPIEVKAGNNAHLKSLQAFMSDSPCHTAVRFWNKPLRKDVIKLEDKEFVLLSLPYYYVGQLETAIRLASLSENF